MTWNYLEDTFGLVLEGLLLTFLFAIFMYMNGRITNAQLHRMGIFRYSARIHELRQEDHDILAVKIKGGLWEFVYRGESPQ